MSLTDLSYLYFTTGEGTGNPVRYPCLENPMDRGAWRAVDGPWGHRELDTPEVTEHVQTGVLRGVGEAAPGLPCRLTEKWTEEV